MQSAFQVGIALLLLALALGALAVMCWRASVAEWRARLLLRDMLTDAEYQQLAADGYLEVTSPSEEQRIYRIPRAGGRVRMYEGEWLVCELCLRSTKSLPLSDLLVLHKLLIEGNEAGYLATANHVAPDEGWSNSALNFWYL